MEFIQNFKNFLLLQKPTPSHVTVKNYVVDVKHFISWYESFFSKPFHPQEVAPSHINNFKEQKAATYSVRSIERHLSSLRKFFYALKMQGVIARSPFDEMPALQGRTNQDPWRLKEFKDFLYVYNASRLTIKNYIIDVKQFVQWVEKHASQNSQQKDGLTTISPDILEAFKLNLIETHVFSATSINRKLSSLRKYFTWASQQGYLSAQIAIPDNLNNITNTTSTNDESLPEIDINKYQNLSNQIMTRENSKKPFVYSKFPPLRLLQKIGKGIDLGVEFVIIAPLTKVAIAVHKQVWKIQGKKLFVQDARFSNALSQPKLGTYVKNIQKAIYAPHAISIKYFPWYRKAWHHARNTRPTWYRKYHSYALAHYFNWAILIIFCTTIGFAMYNTFVDKPQQNPTLAATAPPRILSFQGRLTDSADTPITASTNLRFAIYSDASASGSALLWQEVNGVTPDKNGVFSVLLGKNTTIPQSLFANNQNLYLGITVGTTAELTPRQQLATVAYAANAETLQGMAPITQSGAGTTNVILALNSSGNLSVGASTTFQSTTGQFAIAGNTVALSTNVGSNGNITFTPDGTGFIDFQKPLVNSTTNGNIGNGLGALEVDDLFAVLATSSAAAVVINQNGTGDLLSASSSGVSQFTVGNTGSITSAHYTNAGGVIYTDNTGLFLQTTAGSAGECLASTGGGAPTWASCSGSTNYWNLDATKGTLSTINGTVDVFFGGTATSSANFAFINNAPGSGTPTASISGNLTLNSNGNIQTTNNRPLTIGGNSTGAIIISPNNGTGAVTIDGASLTTTASTFNLINATATTVNFAQAATTLNIGAATGTTTINNDVTVAGATTLNGNITLGNASTDTITATGSFGSNLVPDTTDARDLGAAGLEWNNLYVKNIISGGNVSGFWQRNLGVLSPTNISDDFAVGGTATGSARFQIFGNTGNATTAGTLTFDGTGSLIQTTNNQGLTIGGSTTGNITLSPQNGNGTVTIAGLGNGVVHSTGGVLSTTTVALGSEVSGLLPIANGGTNTNTIGSAGRVVYSNGTSYAFTAIGSLGDCLVSNGSGAPTWGSCSTAAGATNYWTQDNGLGLLYPNTSSLDVLFGGTSTASANFAFINNAPGSGTPTASISGNITLNSAGVIQTTRNQSLTIGGNTTGNITLSPLGGAGAVTIDGNTLITTASNFDLLNTTATTINFGGAADINLSTAGKTTSVNGDFTLVGAANLNGNINLGNASTDTITANGQFGSDLVPTTNDTYNLGSPSLEWDNLYVKNIISNGGTISGFWQRNLGVLSPTNISDDFAIGGTGTGSAKFQIFGNTGNATTAGTLTFDGTGSLIQTTNNQGLTIGGNTTGNITLSPLNGNGTVAINGNKLITNATSFDLLNTNATTINFGEAATTINIGAGTGSTTVNNDLAAEGTFTALGVTSLNADVNLGNASSDVITANGEFGSSLIPTTADTYNLGAPSLEWNTLYIKNIVSNGTLLGAWQRNLGVLAPLNITDDLAIGGTATSTAKFQVFGLTGNATTAGTLTFTNGGSQIQTTSNQPLTLGGNTTGGITLSPNNGTGTVTINGGALQTTASTFNAFTTTATNLGLGVTGGTTTINSGLTITGAITPNGQFAASLIPQSTSVNLGSATNYFGNAYITNLYPAASSVYQGFLQRNLGVLSPTNITDDLAIGGTATSTAKFQVFGLTGNATTAGNLTFSNAGSIQTTSDLPLTLGGTTTGNIILSPNNGTGNVTVNGFFNSNLIPVVTNTYDLGSLSQQWNNVYAHSVIVDGQPLTQEWQRNLGVLSPLNITDDLAIGGTATGAAKFQIIGLSGNATTAGNLTFTGGSSSNVIATRNNQGLTIGDSQTGNITITALNGVAGSTINLNAANLVTNQTSLNLFNTNVATLNFAGAATSANLVTNATTLHLADGAASTTISIGGVSGATTVNNDLAAEGTFTAIGVANLNSDVNLGNATSDTITATGEFGSSLIPNSSNAYDLGQNPSTGNQWRNLYAQNIYQNGEPVIAAWQRNLGVLSPLHISDDLAIGGTATGAAKFQIFGLSGNATTSGNLTFAGTTATNVIAARNMAGITIGDAQTGPIILNGGNVGIGTTTPATTLDVRGANQALTANLGILSVYSTDSQAADKGGSIILGGNDGASLNRAFAGIYGLKENGTSSNSNGYISLATRQNGSSLAERLRITSAGFVGIGTSTVGNAALVVNQTNTSGLGDIITASASGTTQFIVTNGGIVRGASFEDINNTSYLLDPAATGNSLLVAGTVGIGTLNPLSLSGLDIEKNAKGNAALVVANLNTTGDLFTASNSAGTKFTIANNGTISKSGYTTSGGILFATNTGAISQTAAGNLGECLQSAAGGTPVWGTCGTGGNGSYWVLNAATLYPVNSTVDMFVGGSATASAKFAVLNMAPGSGTPVASVSSGLNGTALYLSADGSIQTATANTLTLGGNTTGNITLSPQGGAGSVNISGVTLNSGSPSFNLFNSPTTLTFAQAATSLTIGANTGATTFRSPTIDDSQSTATLFGTPTSVTFAGAATTLNIGNASGTTTVQGNFAANGNVTLGTSNSNTITSNGLYNSDIIPSGNGSINLGSSNHYYNTVYANNFVAPVGGGQAGYWSLSNDVLFPSNTFYDLAVGGTATGSATPWQVFSQSIGVDTAGTATSSGGLSFRGTTTNVNLLNGSVLKVNTSVGGDEGTTTQLQLDNNGDLTLGGANIKTTQGAVSLFNTTATNISFAGAATTLSIGFSGSNTSLKGNLTLGSSNTNTIFLNGKFSSSLLPTSNGINIGASGNEFGNGYFTNLFLTGQYGGFWQRSGSVVAPIDIANDLAIGGNSTASALFQVFGTSGTASTSGQLSFKTNSQVNLLNNAALGFYNSVGGDSGINLTNPALYVNNNGRVGIGTTNPILPLHVVMNNATSSLVTPAGRGIAITAGSAGYDRLYFEATNAISGQKVFTIDNGNTSGILSFGSLNDFGSAFTNENILALRYDGSVGIGTNTPLAQTGLDIEKNALGNAALVTNQLGLGDVFTASSSGAPLFTIANDGTIRNGLIPNATDTYNLGSDPTLGGKEWDTLYVRQIVTPSNGGLAGFWQLSNNGVLAPANTTNDLVLGGNSTASARFQIFGSGTGVGTIAATLNDPKVNNNAGVLLPSLSNIINIASKDHTYMTLTNSDLTIGGHKNMQSISNVQKVFIYDTSKDTDGGAWTNDERAQASSWYNEPATTGDICAIGTNARCGQQAFPKKAIIVVTTGTTGSVYIFDAKDNSLWMRFDKGASTTENMVGPTSNDTASSVAALNGKIYLATGGFSGTAGALYVIDFTKDISYKYNDTGYYVGSNTIQNRNTQDTYSLYTNVYGTLSPAGFANRFIDVAVNVINGQTYIAGGSRSGVVVYNESTQTEVATFDTIGIASNVALTSTGDLYATMCTTSANPCSQYVLKVKHNIQNTTFGTNKTFDEVYGYNSSSNYGATTTDNNTFSSITFTAGPSATTSASFVPPVANGLAVTQGTSTVDGHSNTIYLAEGGSNGSVAVIQEKQGDPRNGSIKYYNSNYITEDMVGDTRGMWPFNETSGNLLDASVQGITLTASSSGVTYSASGVRGKALTFDGSSGFVYCTNSNCGGTSQLGIDGTQKKITVGAWVKTSASGNRQVIISKWNNSIGGSYLLTVEGSGKVMWALNGLTTNLTSVRTVNDGNWHHIVGTYDGTNQNLYIDGQMDAQQAKSVAFATSTGDFLIGAYLNSNNYAGWFNGSIDEPFVSADPLTAGEIAHMYQVGYRALQNHSSKTIRGGAVVSTDGSQKLFNGNSNVSAVAANMQNGQIYIGTKGGGTSVIGMDSDTITDLYNSSINTVGDAGTTWGESANNNFVQSIATGQSYGNGTALVIGNSNSGTGNTWMETQDTSLKEFMADSYNPFGTNLTQSNLNVDSVLRVSNPLSTRLDNNAFGATSSASFADAFRVDSNGNLLSRSLVNNTNAMQFQNANGDGLLTIDTTGNNQAFQFLQPGSGDIMIASNSAGTQFQLTNSGILRSRSFQDLDNTSYFLDPAASTLSLTVAGNVGIGTTSASVRLSVKGTSEHDNAEALELWNPSQTGYLYAGYATQNSAGVALTTPTAYIGAWSPSAGSLENLMLNAAKVGIGTDAPSYKLHVQDSSGYIGLSVPNTNFAHIETDRPQFWFNTDVSVNTGNFVAYNTSNLSLITGSSTRMTILNSSGYVGVGDTSPSSPLTVVGDGDGIRTSTTGSDTVSARFFCASSTGNCYIGSATSSRLVFRTSDADRGAFDSGGKLGLGTISPSAELMVVGAAGSANNFEHTNSNSFEFDDSGNRDALYGGTDPGFGGNFRSYIQSVHIGTTTNRLSINPRGGNVDLNAGAGSFDYAEIYHSNQIIKPGELVQISHDATWNGTPDYGGVVINASNSAYFDHPETNNGKVIERTTSAYSPVVLGVASSRPAVIINEGTVSFTQGTPVNPSGSNTPPIDLAGRAPVNISTINGPIHYGDPITSSDIAGMGMKSTKAGYIVGRAMEEFDPANGSTGDVGIIPCPEGSPSNIVCGQVYVYATTTWNDPDVYLTSTGDMQIADASPSADFTIPHYYTLNDALGGSITRMGAFVELAVANIRAGSIQTQQLFTNSLALATANITIAGQSLHDYILSVVQEAGLTNGQVTSSNSVKTNIISPLNGGNVALRLTNSGIEVARDASSSAVASIDNNGNATFSGTLNSGNLAVNSDATISGTLHANRIEANEIAGLNAIVGTLSAQNITNVTNIYFATPSGTVATANTNTGSNTISSTNSGALTPQIGYANIASYSGFLAYVPNLSAATATFGQGLVSTGTTSLSDTTVSGQLAIGTQLILADNSVNVLGGTFQIQSLAQGDVSFEGGLIAIDTNGNLTVDGNAVFAKNLAANVITPLANDKDLTLKLGDNSASGSALATSTLNVQNASGSGVFNIDQLGNVIASGAASIGKLNFNAVQPALAVSDTEVVATGSAGTTAIKAHQTEVTIDNPLVTNKSLIYITPVGQTTYTPYLLRQVGGKSFTVGIPVQQYVDTTFNWLIVN